jgi:hypothetical protein
MSILNELLSFQFIRVNLNMLLTLPKAVFLPIFLLFSFHAFSQIYQCEEELFPRKDKATRLYGYVNAIGEYRVPPTFLKAKPFSGKTAIVQQGNRFGVIGCDGNLVIPAEYDEIASFTDGKGWVKKNGLYGLMNMQGRFLIPLTYEEVKEINVYSGTASWVKKGGLWGLISKENGRLLLNPRYEDVSVISDSAAIGRLNSAQDLIYSGDGRVIIQGMRSVRKISPGLFVYESSSRKSGVFNSLAFTILRPEFSSIRLNWQFLQTRTANGSGLRSLRGITVLEEKYDTISAFLDGYASIRRADSAQIISSRGNFNLPPGRYAQTMILKNGFAIVQKDGKTGFWLADKKAWHTEPIHQLAEVSADFNWIRIRQADGSFVIQAAGNEPVSRIAWDKLHLDDPASAIRAEKAGKLFLISVSKQAPTRGYDEINPLGQGFFACREGRNFSLISGLSDQILPAEYSSIQKYSTSVGTCFAAEKDGNVVLFSDKGKPLIQGIFEDLIPAPGKKFLAASGGKWGISKSDGSWIVENRYDSVKVIFRLLDEARFPVVFYRKGKSALLDEQGRELTDAAICSWFDGGEGKVFRKQNSGYTLLDAQGKVQGDLIFEDFRPFSEGNALVKSNGRWGFLNHTGKLVIPARFEDALPFQGGIAYAKENGLWGVLRKNGNWLVKPSGVGVATDADGKRRLILP